MIPLIVSGAVSLASDVVDAWKTHAANTAAAKAANSPEFQEALKTAAAKAAAATQQQKLQAMPTDINTVTQEILAAPDVRSMAHSSPTASVNLQFNANGDLFTPQTNGGMRQIMVGPDVRQQLQQLNATMKSPGTGLIASTAHVNAEISSIRMPVQVNLAAV
jgi:cell division protein FtsX